MNSYFFILADRGNVRAYRAEKARGERPPQLHLVQAITLAGAQLSAREKFSDEAGAFPVTESSGQGGRHQNAIAERHFEIEETRRLVKQLAGHIDAILRQEQPGWWSLAAPPDLVEAVLGEIEPASRELLAERVPRDLVKVPPGQILQHFTAVRAAPEPYEESRRER